MRPVPLGIDPHLKAFLEELRGAVRELQEPGKPPSEFATTFANLPPAASYKNCRCIVIDKNCLATSTPVAGVYTWLRADGTAL